MLEITRKTMMQGLGAPPVWKSNRANAKENRLGYDEDPEQAVTPLTSAAKQGMGLKATRITVIPNSDADSHAESESSKSRNNHSSLGTAPEGPSFRAQAKGALPASLSKLTQAPLEKESSFYESSGPRSVNLRLPTRLVAKWKRVKEVGDLHRLQDDSQLRNRDQEYRDDKLEKKFLDEPPVKSIQFLSELCPYEPFLEVIRIPSQRSGDKSMKSEMINQSKDVFTGKHKKKAKVRESLSFNGSSPIPPKRKLLRAIKSFDERDFVEKLGRHQVPYKSSKDGTASVEPPTAQKAKGAPTPRDVQLQSSRDQDAKPKKATSVSQKNQPQLGSSAVSGVDGAHGSRSKIDTRPRRNQKATVVYITRAR
jgi:hypothetical protein